MSVDCNAHRFIDRRSDSQPKRAPGLYVHLPFCSVICPYCDFAVATGDRVARRRFVDGLLREIELWSAPKLVFDTVYFGGGTPSLLEVGELARILAALRDRFGLAPDTTFFLEANPEDVDRESLQSWFDLGFDSLSLGVQALDDHNLRFLGRGHRSEQARKAIRLAVDSPFRWVSIDMMYVLPGDSAASWRETLAAVTDFGPDHLSCYELTVHQGTPFAALEASGRLIQPAEARRAELFEVTHLFLAERGFEGYEVSNFARDLHSRSRHNQKYWTHVPYLGLGPSAHSFDGRRRWWNERHWKNYLRRVESGDAPVSGEEELGSDELVVEAVLLGLRTASGLRLPLLADWLQVDLLESKTKEIQQLQSDGLLVLEGDTLRPTVRGLALADQIARQLV